MRHQTMADIIDAQRSPACKIERTYVDYRGHKTTNPGLHLWPEARERELRRGSGYGKPETIA